MGWGVVTSFRILFALFCIIGCCFCMFSCHFTLFYVLLRQMATYHIALTFVVFFFCYLDRFFIHLLNICVFLFIKSILLPPPTHTQNFIWWVFPHLINPSLLLIIQYDISWSNIEKSELRTLRTIPVNLVVPQKLGYSKSHIAILKLFS